jgi:hypothetical protein
MITSVYLFLDRNRLLVTYVLDCVTNIVKMHKMVLVTPRGSVGIDENVSGRSIFIFIGLFNGF